MVTIVTLTIQAECFPTQAVSWKYDQGKWTSWQNIDCQFCMNIETNSIILYSLDGEVTWRFYVLNSEQGTHQDSEFIKFNCQDVDTNLPCTVILRFPKNTTTSIVYFSFQNGNSAKFIITY